MTSNELSEQIRNRLTPVVERLGSTMWRMGWKRWIMPSGRVLYRLVLSEARTLETACTSWPTPNAGPQNDQDSNWEARREECKERHGNNGFGLTLGMASSLASWPTPNVPNGGRVLSEERTLAGVTETGRKVQVDLGAVANLTSWATPRANDAEKRGAVADDPRNGLVTQANLSSWATPRSEDSESTGAHRGTPDTLTSQSRLSSWATPRSTEAGHSTGNPERAMDGKSRLEDQVFLSSWATPAARDWRSNAASEEHHQARAEHPRGKPLSEQAHQLTDSGPTPNGSPAATVKAGQLNPGLPRWLMGLPPEWCLCAPTKKGK